MVRNVLLYSASGERREYNYVKCHEFVAPVFGALDGKSARSENCVVMRFLRVLHNAKCAHVVMPP